MPHATLKLVGGANTEETPALNENSGISQTQLVRYMYDPNGISLVQKLGGWVRYINQTMVAVVRALWAWEDINQQAWLALGTQTISGQSYSQLAVINDGTLVDISPTTATDNIAAVVTSTAGSYSFIITDNTTLGVTNYDTVYIATQISIGGVILFGLYACSPDGILLPNGYTVWARDILGNLEPATSSSSMPVLPSFTTLGPTGSPPVPGSSQVTVTLPNYTYAVGDTFSVLTPTMVGGITLYGNYVVQSIIDANNFTIVASTTATSSATGTLNGGLAQFIYSFGVGAIPTGLGYGIGEYGIGLYGQGAPITPATGIAFDAVDWTFDNFGEYLLACPIQPPSSGTPFQPLYVWPPGQPTATIVSEAPAVNDGVLVAMPQRQVVLWGSTETGIQDPLLIQWSDVGRYDVWTDLVTNQAGTYRIPTGSRIVGCLQVPQQILVWTDVDVYSMQYINLPDVYGFNQIGKGCGMIGRKAAGVINGIPFWMGSAQFYSLTAYGVQPVQCPVWDIVFQNLYLGDNSHLPLDLKIRCAVNSRFGEIQWFYPSANGSGETDSYVKYNAYLNTWDYGTLGRTAWVDQSVLGPPIGADPSSLYIFQHETSNDADGQAMGEFFRTGYYTISEGDFQSFVDWVWPDMKWGQYSQAQTAQVQISFFVAQYPNDTPVQYGPYTMTQAIEYFYTRFRGRLVSVQIGNSTVGSFWRTGAVRYRFSQDGRI